MPADWIHFDGIALMRRAHANKSVTLPRRSWVVSTRTRHERWSKERDMKIGLQIAETQRLDG